MLVNSAGCGLLGYLEEISEKLIRQHIETNVLGTMKITRAVLQIMRKQRSGWIIVVSSTSGIRAVEGNPVYSASKFALEGWTEGMSIDLKPFGIRCMIVEPGAFRTDFFNEKTSPPSQIYRLTTISKNVKNCMIMQFHGIRNNQLILQNSPMD